MVVELIARHVWQMPSTRSLPPALLRLIASLAGASYILVLVGVNLAGYAVGVGGASEMLARLYR